MGIIFAIAVLNVGLGFAVAMFWGSAGALVAEDNFGAAPWPAAATPARAPDPVKTARQRPEKPLGVSTPAH